MDTNERELEFQLTEESWGRIRAFADALLNVIMLDELREARRMAHTKLMDTLQIGRSEVSRIEHRTDLYINALDTYLKDQDALLEIWAVFPHGRIRINRLADFAECSSSFS